VTAGQLDRRVRLERPVETLSPSGSPVTTWQLVATVWAGKRDTTAREYFSADSTRAEGDTVWTIRWRDGVQNKWRLVHGSDVYDIEGLSEIGRRQWITLFCKRGQL
jgi:SPP1 family predicted phage head-tail adaptor